jgi:ABC-type antimicrobial peptide transport system permease subunit
VLQRRKEIGICLALGARVRHVAHQVTAKMAVMVGAGGIAGIALGIATSRYAESLFYEVTSSDPANLIAPSLIMAAVAMVAALPPLLHAVRIDPVTMLRSE